MIYDLSKTFDRDKARKRFDFLFEKGRKIDLIEKTFRRTLRQNAYLHVILKYYGVQVGLNAVEAKIDFKTLNVDFFNYQKNDKWYIKSSADLDKEELSICIDRFIKDCGENGILIPRSDEPEFIDEALNEIEKARRYL